MDERPGLPERDEAGRFLLGEDPLVSVGVRIPTSVRERLRELARAKGRQPTVLARLLLCEAIQGLWDREHPEEKEAASARLKTQGSGHGRRSIP
jgi:hypothetical protein